MKQDTTTLLITGLPHQIQNALITDPTLYFEHLAALCGTATRFKLPKPGVLFITMLSVPECQKLKQMLDSLKAKPEFQHLSYKNVDQRTKPFQVIGLVGDKTGLSDVYEKNTPVHRVEEFSSRQLTSIWQIINRDSIESFIRWRQDGIWFFVLKLDNDPKYELQLAQERLDKIASDEQRESLKLLHLKTPLPIEDTEPEGYTGKYKRIFLGHLTIGLEEQCVRSHFSSFGDIRHVQIPKKKDGRTKGIAFVDYYDTTPVKLALLKNNMYFADNHIKVAEATEARKSSLNDNGERFMQGVSVVEAAYSSHNRQQQSYNQQSYNDGADEGYDEQYQDDGYNNTEGAEQEEEGAWENNAEPEDDVDATQVFVCNVTYEAPPRKLKKLLKKAGDIEEFRPIMKDGEFMGKAFCRFETAEGATAALEMNGTDFMGRPITIREVKISKAEMQRNKRKRDGQDANSGGQRNKRQKR